MERSRLTPPVLFRIPPLCRRLLPTLAVATLLACSGDDLTGPSVVDGLLTGRRLAVSADNGKIAFESQRDGNAEIYVMNPNGTGETNLTNNPAFDTTPAWSPDGTRIAFGSLRTGDFEIFVMNADGTNPVNLTNSANTDLFPSWSPDGTKIAFHTFRDAGSGLQSEIYVMNANGSNQTNLSQNAAIDVDPQWSPDGSKIAFMRQVPFSSNAEIYVMDAATGANQTNLTNDPAADGDASWSPDGSRIAFGSSRDDNFGEVYSMNANGSGVTRLTNNPGGDGEPAWSPDGTKIAFTTARDGDLQIYAMNTDGSGPVPLTAPPGRNALAHWGTAPGTTQTCAEAVTEARSRIRQLLPNRPVLRFLLIFFTFRMEGGSSTAETNFGLLLDSLAQAGIIGPQDAADLKALVAIC